MHSLGKKKCITSVLSMSSPSLVVHLVLLISQPFGNPHLKLDSFSAVLTADPGPVIFFRSAKSFTTCLPAF